MTEKRKEDRNCAEYLATGSSPGVPIIPQNNLVSGQVFDK